MRMMRLSLGVLSLVAAWPQSALACTVFLVGKDATEDGSSIVTHSNDGEFDTDPRLVKIPSISFAPGERKRPVFYTPETYPRYVGMDRGNVPEYFPTKENPNPFQPIGEAPDLGLEYNNRTVASTHAYLEDTYGIVNSAGLAMGESTCSGVFGAVPLGAPNGTALWSIDELTRIAMERASTSKEAVYLMGTLAEYHGGFYGAGQFEGTAESLAITDTVSGESWIFHILPDPTGTSAIWAAQRIPSNAFAVLANMFVIRNIDPDNNDDYLMSDNVHTIAIEYGWYDPDKDGLLDFTKVYSDGEYAHKFYSGRRMWGAYRLACPDDKFKDDYSDLQSDPVYPVYCVPRTKVSVRDVMSFHRDYYAGTKYDLTMQGNLAGGPFSSPDRWKEGPNEAHVGGAWERAIAMYRTSDTFIVQTFPDTSTSSHAEEPDAMNDEPRRTGVPSEAVVWYGPSSALATVFTPFVVSMKDVPDTFRSGHPFAMDRRSAFWAATTVTNLSNLKWSYMIRDIRYLQNRLESESASLVKAIAASGVCGMECNCRLIDNANKVAEELWQLSDHLMFKYASGFVNEPDNMAQPVGYPAWWLDAVGYSNGPPPPPTKPRCCHPTPATQSRETSNIDSTEASRDALRPTETAAVKHFLRSQQM